MHAGMPAHHAVLGDLLAGQTNCLLPNLLKIPKGGVDPLERLDVLRRGATSSHFAPLHGGEFKHNTPLSD